MRAQYWATEWGLLLICTEVFCLLTAKAVDSDRIGGGAGQDPWRRFDCRATLSRLEIS